MSELEQTKEGTFSMALEALKEGKKVKMTAWKDDVFISLESPKEGDKMTHPFLYVTSRFGCVPWVVTQVELLSDSWVVVG